MSTIYVNTINPQSGTEVSVGGSVSGSSKGTFVTGLTTAGPLNVTGTVTAPGIVSGSRGGDKSYVVLNASNQLVLDEGGGGAAGVTQANQGNNRIITSVDASNINAEANLSFNGSTLAVTGDTSGSARGIFVTGLVTAGPLNVTGTATFAGDATVGDDLSLTSDAAILKFGDGNDVTFTHDGGTGMDVASAGDFDIAVSAGDATFTVADTKTLILGQTGASELKLSPHSTAGSELASLINTAGTAMNAIGLTSSAGGITLEAAGGVTLSGSVRLYESKLSFSTGSLSPYVQYKTPSDGGQLKHRLVVDTQPHVGAYSTSGPLLEISASQIHFPKSKTLMIGTYSTTITVADPITFLNQPVWTSWYNTLATTHTTNGANYGATNMNVLKPTGSMNIALSNGLLGSTATFVMGVNGFNANVIPGATIGDWTSIIFSEIGQNATLMYSNVAPAGWFITNLGHSNAASGSLATAPTGSNNLGMLPQVDVDD